MAKRPVGVIFFHQDGDFLDILLMGLFRYIKWDFSTVSVFLQGECTHSKVPPLRNHVLRNSILIF